MFLQNEFLKRKRKRETVIKVKEKPIKDIPRDHERIKRNWLSGKHELRETTLAVGLQSSGPCHLLIDMNRNNLLVYQHQPRLLRIFDRSDTTYQHNIPISPNIYCARFHQDLVFCGGRDSISVLDQNGHTIRQLQVPKSKAVEDLFVDSSNRLVSYSYDAQRVPQLHVWQMTPQREFQLTYDERMTSFRARSRPVQMDDLYIVIIVFGQKDSDFSEIYFLSTKSMNIERSLSTRTRVHRYQSGLFFFYKDGRVSVIDVATGQRLGTIHQTLDVDASDLRAELPIKLNSQFVVMLTCQDKQTVFVIYKLEDVRKANNQTVTPINEVKMPRVKISNFLVDETQIVFMKSGLTKIVSIIDFT